MAGVPTATACPKCGSGAYRTIRPPDKVFTFTNYRQCLACQTVYARPTPLWAALAALVVGGGFLSMAVYQFVQGSAKGVLDGLDDAWKAGAMGLTVCSFGIIALVKWQPARARPKGGGGGEGGGGGITSPESVAGWARVERQLRWALTRRQCERAVRSFQSAVAAECEGLARELEGGGGTRGGFDVPRVRRIVLLHERLAVAESRFPATGLAAYCARVAAALRATLQRATSGAAGGATREADQLVWDFLARPRSQPLRQEPVVSPSIVALGAVAFCAVGGIALMLLVAAMAKGVLALFAPDMDLQEAIERVGPVLFAMFVFLPLGGGIAGIVYILNAGARRQRAIRAAPAIDPETDRGLARLDAITRM